MSSKAGAESSESAAAEQKPEARNELRQGEGQSLYERQAADRVSGLKAEAAGKISRKYGFYLARLVEITRHPVSNKPETTAEAIRKVYLDALIFFDLIPLLNNESTWLGDGALRLSEALFLDEKPLEKLDAESIARILYATDLISECFERTQTGIRIISGVLREGIVENNPISQEILRETARWSRLLDDPEGGVTMPSERVRSFVSMTREFLENETALLALYYELAEFSRRLWRQGRSELRNGRTSKPE